MVENLILSGNGFLLFLYLFYFDSVVSLVEGVKFLEQYNSVFISVYLLEQRTYLFLFQTEVETPT